VTTFDITPDKPGYVTGEVITVTLSTDAPMTQSTTITGSAELPNGTKMTDSTTTTITGTYAVAADGYTAAQTDDPAVWTLTPVPAS